ncbi:MAG: exosortase K [Spirochaetales bacterium]|nr:exosortase K [Spirochaetales bacterium]
MKEFTKLIILMLSLIAAITIHFVAQTIEPSKVLFLLHPIKISLEILLNCRFVFDPAIGYICPAQNFVISVKCAGISYISCACLIALFFYFYKTQNLSVKKLSIIIALGIITGFTANLTRVFFSVFFTMSLKSNPALHLIWGFSCFSIFIVAMVFLIKKISKEKLNENF